MNKITFHLVHYSQIFENWARTEIIVSNNFDAWKQMREKHGCLFCVAEEISMREAFDQQHRSSVRVEYMD